VQQRSVELAELRGLLGGGDYVAIVLVDKLELGIRHLRVGGWPPRLLRPAARHYAAAPNDAATITRALLKGTRAGEGGGGGEDSGGGSAVYIGHYVVLQGWDAERDEFCVSDPDPQAPAAAWWVPSAALEAARKRFGTDEDLLLVPRQQVDL
jgi:hypothetical protein